ncbi:hypothetical protein M0805_004775 [Coniferiporia weirii]|nr:hypothetical protein M0805_004775 [Coniferiporia weirii]
MESDSLDAIELIEGFKTTLACVLIGFAVSTTLYGITCLQLYMYYRSRYNDHLSHRILVGVLWILDTLSTALVAHTLYTYLVLRLDSSSTDFIVPWSYTIQIETVDLTTFIAQTYAAFNFFITSSNAPYLSFFAWQIWKVSKNRLVVIFIVFLAFCAIGLDMEVIAELFRNQSVLSLGDPTVWITGSTVQGLDALCDIVIMVSFIYYLNSRRTGVKSTERIVDNLILYAVSRGIVTVVTQLVFVSLDVAFPGQVYWVPFQQTVGKLYVNSVLVSLNSRRAVRAPEMISHLQMSSSSQFNESSIYKNKSTPPMVFASNGEIGASSQSCIEENV